MLDVNFFDELKIGLATADDIHNWSYGEVKKPETINYRTLKPEKDGLFCEKIFGPTRDWECYCGKYKRVRFKGIICERCGVEVTKAKVRRERMGHIELAAPVTHIWYFKGVPSRLGYLLDLAPKDLEKIIYFAAYVITAVDDELRHNELSTLEAEMEVEKKAVADQRDVDLNERQQKLEQDLAELEAEGAKADVRRKVKDGAEREMRRMRDSAQRELDALDELWDKFTKLAPRDLIIDEKLYHQLVERYGEYFTGSMGAEAIKKLLETFDIDAEADSLRDTIRNGKGQKKLRALKRLKVVAAFQQSGNSPLGMVLDAVPVIPPELRPMVQLDGGRFATSDLNDLYRRVINRNNRLKRLIDLGAPEIIVNNEKRMLQESVDALFDNGRRGRPVTGPGNRPLKSLSDLLKGKQGRFRQNLLGKRVDYSGRSVIVVGPQLKLHQCGLPKLMALELFKPFVMKRLVDLNQAQNIKSAKRMVERQRPAVWDVLEEVIAEHPVLLNRAPTLHRLGIQAFEPQLVEGKAIQLHPLVCEAFNADFDGDQMAVHLPLSAEAQAEARILMLSSNNILSPASGRPLAMPRLDMVTGLYYLTTLTEGAVGEYTPATADDVERGVYSSPAEAIMAVDRGALTVQSRIKVRLTDQRPPAEIEAELFPEGWSFGQPWDADTTLGRVLFNELLPVEYPYVNEQMPKKRQAVIINDLAERYPMIVVAQTVDKLKDVGFYWATRSGVTVSMADVLVPPQKAEILDKYEERADGLERKFQRGALTPDERRDALVEIWKQATEEVGAAMEAHYPDDNPIPMIVKSGAAGNMTQIRSLAGMKGLVTNPKGEFIPRPIKSSFREGLTVAEYFINTHGARKGLADTALRTADSGYLTRRLVDVSQDVIVREVDCGTERGITTTIAERQPDGTLIRDAHVETSTYARTLATDALDADGNVIVERGHDLGDPAIEALLAAGITQVKVRSVLTCATGTGVCAHCYGRSMATGKLVDIGEAVGIIAAQSIGEPGTQLTMRTFHQGGVGDDITGGLPRVQELFEARVPKGVAPIAEVSGRVRLEDDDRFYKITIVPDDGSEEVVIDKISKRQRLRVFKHDDGSERLLSDGDHVEVGQQLMEGSANPHEVLRVMGPRQVQVHLVNEVQEVYRSQGVSIHDKHIETIVRQMLRRVTIIDHGSTEFLPGSLVERAEFEAANRQVVAEGGEPAAGRPVLMGITKASLATESWLSAASFQETTRVLTDAAINSRSDKLIGLKENVIIGKLIPAGTGINRYRNIQVQPTEEARAAAYAVPSYDDTYYSPDGTFGAPAGAAVPLDDYGFSNDYR
ncbi:DNA-directed RNA polymerase, beta' subunit [Gordonia bronchialis DSM 43247]|uniref:DNA-directed RNA polymerase subunit beta' n=1 Tax=Gordonia bronchialis (strain ATCC 25592 / DSM 43247 / BCRC 13721 / JCM 3198 / KCTC 3076 / NBRC 16047 / NCTC 10667) TaxID=526226 RepID=D0L4Z5_GORB4|nr:DNA-directed RNA polymerase subunit beta' [Gordonia bronchialis]ACY20447.1 DNA-directed RNA polymerase, beta' subunit [Gordonia bronchialis DSM 43247]MCC3323223.1 DNA-directed RNA polymerase subunit beta' [Gordonia bronchialis]QGS25758.1 DNA-directed RNA polymerase subunit beta' [Gordonia bronchialis]UAK37843.1 DNA-directed RNA polymerase subunit beta' [Gordonia bronchialis]STQ63252.1 DNA-directed RNA polymerase subunit beta' [Gordonia bronchialis]